MRKTCLLSVYELASKDERVVFIGSDITKRDLEKLATEHAERFFLEGIYEQHIIGMAAGMALEGKIPYVNTIATFLTRRCYEQVLLDLGMHKLNVRLIGSGGGVVYAPLGSTHLANEDIAIMRVIPGMTVIAPCDADEMKRLMPQTLEWNGPIYIRLAKGGDEIVSRPDIEFVIGKAIELEAGEDGYFITTGITTQIALRAVRLLREEGIKWGVAHFHTIKPLDTLKLEDIVRKANAIITVEEHNIIGGLGSAVVEFLIECKMKKNILFKRMGFPDVFTDEFGSQNDIMKKYGLYPEGLKRTVLELLNGK